MAQSTSIEWTDATWNPVHGCSKVSPGCAHCYAETLSRRYKQTLKAWTPANAAENVLLKPHKIDEPRKWKAPRMVFVNSMSDLFHELVPFEYIREVFTVMAECPQHTFQVLTKRPERMRDFCVDWYDYDESDPPGTRLDPLPNVWLGVSIENRRFVHRADVLRQTPAAVRFISAEPLLGPLTPLSPFPASPYVWWAPSPEFTTHRDEPGLDLTGIDWVICGGESGPRHRPIERSWVVSLLDACLARRWEINEGEIVGLRDGPPFFFFKQWGGARPKSNGRELDGRTWDEMPERAA